jgi:dihydrofolate synthase/folylpolyglutamate synthase
MAPSVAAEAARIGARAVRAGAEYTWQVQGPGGRWSFRGAQQFDALAPPGLAGARQYANAAAAIATLSEMGVALEPAAISHALRSLQLPGRFQVVAGPVEWILDVAHNEPAARVLAQNLRERSCAGRTLLVAGILGDKDVGAIAPVLAGVADRIFLCGIAAPRGLTAAQLASRSPHFATAEQCEDIAAGMHCAAGQAQPGDRIVVCGSFLAVAPALERLGLY